MRSKTKVIQKPIPIGGTFPNWSFDGSSTGQAEGDDPGHDFDGPTKFLERAAGRKGLLLPSAFSEDLRGTPRPQLLA